MVDIELEVCCTLGGGEGRLQMRAGGLSVCREPVCPSAGSRSVRLQGAGLTGSREPV